VVDHSAVERRIGALAKLMESKMAIKPAAGGRASRLSQMQVAQKQRGQGERLMQEAADQLERKENEIQNSK
jgi:hypothetical protein